MRSANVRLSHRLSTCSCDRAGDPKNPKIDVFVLCRIRPCFSDNGSCLEARFSVRRKSLSLVVRNPHHFRIYDCNEYQNPPSPDVPRKARELPYISQRSVTSLLIKVHSQSTRTATNNKDAPVQLGDRIPHFLGYKTNSDSPPPNPPKVDRCK